MLVNSITEQTTIGINPTMNMLSDTITLKKRIVYCLNMNM